MATLRLNQYSSWQLTEQEQEQGSLLTITQKQVIQNQVAVIAEQILALEFDVKNPEKFIQEDAGYKGQMASLNYLLECSESIEESIRIDSEVAQEF